MRAKGSKLWASALQTRRRRRTGRTGPTGRHPCPADQRDHRALASSAAATAGCGPRCWPRSATRRPDVVLLEVGRVRLTPPPGATADSAPRASPTGSPTARTASRTRSPSWNGSAGRTSTQIEDTLRRYGIDCDFERTGELAVATAAVPARRARTSRRELARPVRPRVELLDRDAGAGRGRLADLPGRAVGPRPGGHGRPGQAGLGPAPGLPDLGVRIYEGTPVTRAARRRRATALHRCAPPHGEVRARRGSRWPPTRSRRCCAGCGAT